MFDKDIVLSLVNNSNEAIIAINLDGKVILWNKSAENLFGISQEKVLGKLFPLVKNKASFELETILTKTKEGKPINFKTQKQTKNRD